MKQGIRKNRILSDIQYGFYGISNFAFCILKFVVYIMLFCLGITLTPFLIGIPILDVANKLAKALINSEMLLLNRITGLEIDLSNNSQTNFSSESTQRVFSFANIGSVLSKSFITFIFIIISYVFGVLSFCFSIISFCITICVTLKPFFYHLIDKYTNDIVIDYIDSIIPQAAQYVVYPLIGIILGYILLMLAKSFVISQFKSNKSLYNLV